MDAKQSTESMGRAALADYLRYVAAGNTISDFRAMESKLNRAADALDELSREREKWGKLREWLVDRSGFAPGVEVHRFAVSVIEKMDALDAQPAEGEKR